jgi:Domain of unknown function (DUF5076)
MIDLQDKPIYEALVIPNDALDKGGVEILRAGIVQDELYVTARRAFDDPGMWGEVLGDVTRRIARVYAAEGRYTEKDALAAISGAFAADLGTPVVSEKRKTRTPARKAAAKRKPKPESKRAKTSARRKARR